MDFFLKISNAALLTALALPTPASADVGGLTSSAFAGVGTFEVIDGPCLSACTWRFVLNQNACFTPRAYFSFHRSANPHTKNMDVLTTAYLVESVRPRLREQARKVLYTTQLIPVSSSQMRSAYSDRICKG
jgi:hypothetical protein